jgi:outer membrane protein assembly factor BamB
MELPNRLLRILYDEERDRLVGTDVVGRIHALTPSLELERSSPVMPYNQPVYAVTLAGPYVVTRDRSGNLVKWDADSLDPIDTIDAAYFRDESSLLPGEEPSPAVARGLTVWNGVVYTNNGYVQLALVDLETFSVRSILPSISGDVMLEWICTDRPGLDAVSDKAGNLYLGSLEAMDFPIHVVVDEGSNLHRIRYDARFDRFWVTQDSGEGEQHDVSNGIAIVRPDGTVETSVPFARDDVEFLELTPDCGTAYSGGFDGYVHVFDNSDREPRIKALLGPFTHQISDGALAPDGTLYVLSQDGNLVAVDGNGKHLAEAPFRPQCVWDIQESKVEPGTFYCAADDGVAVIRVESEPGLDSVRVSSVDRHQLGFGFVRRVLTLSDGDYVGISRRQRVFRASGDGCLRWTRVVDGLPMTISVSPDEQRLILATDLGGLELDAATGEVCERFSLDDVPIWTTAYLPTGERVFGTRNGRVAVFGIDGEVARQVDLGDYPKRMWATDGVLYVVGENGLRELDAAELSVRRQWFGDVLNNTRENAVVTDGAVHMVAYGQQLGTYDYETGEMIGLLEDFQELPKGLALVRSERGTPFLLVGSRGGAIRTLRIDDRVPKPIRETHLAR